MSLIQIHWQWKDGKTEVSAQREINSNREMDKFIKDCWKDHPPPDDAVFLAVLEDSELFVKTAAQPEDSPDKDRGSSRYFLGGNMDITDAAIASPHWEACNTCAFLGDNGCVKSYINMSVYLGDWIICDDYENNKEIESD